MRRPGESVGGYLLASGLGRLLRGRRAGAAHSIGTLLPAPDSIRLTSTSFPPGGPIPDAHAGAGRGGNRSPQLQWSGVPEGTEQLLLVMEDADVPMSRPVLHTVALIRPDRSGLDEAELRPGTDGVRFLRGAFGRRGYHGPRALPRHGVHHYGFFLYALDRALPEDADPRGVEQLVAQVAGHALARGSVVGTQEG